MKPEDKLKEARLRSGLSEADMAARLQISVSHYYDLEGCDDEVEMTLSISKIVILCYVISLRPFELFSLPAEPEKDSIDSLQRALKSKYLESKLSLDNFSLKVGWDVGPFFGDRSRILDFNIDGLQAICEAAEKNWSSILEDAYITSQENEVNP